MGTGSQDTVVNLTSGPATHDEKQMTGYDMLSSCVA